MATTATTTKRAEAKHTRKGVYVKIPAGITARVDTAAKSQGFTDAGEWLAAVLLGAAHGPVTIDRLPMPEQKPVEGLPLLERAESL